MPILSFNSPEWTAHLIERPEDVRVANDGQTLILRSGENTDWWRTAPDSTPEENVDRHSGPLYTFCVPDATQNWTAGVWMAVEHVERFQQATLFIGQGDFAQGRQPWLKVGVEIEDEKQNIGSVVAAPTSDWTLFPAPAPISADKGSWLYVEAKRTKGDLILYYGHGSPNDKALRKHLIREVKGFAKHLQAPWHVGLMTCGPKSKETLSTYHQFTFTKEE